MVEHPLQTKWHAIPSRLFLRTRSLIRRFPCKVLVLLIALSLALRELYPFSHYPLYTTFDRKSWYVYLTDQDDKPLPAIQATRTRTSRMKKLYNSRLRKLEAKKKEESPQNSALETVAAQQTLDFLLSLKHVALPPETREIRLHRVDLRLTNQAMARETKLLGSRPVSK